MGVSPEMEIIIGAFRQVEQAIFHGGKFERRDLEFIKRYCTKLIEVTDRTLAKHPPTPEADHEAR